LETGDLRLGQVVIKRVAVAVVKLGVNNGVAMVEAVYDNFSRTFTAWVPFLVPKQWHQSNKELN